MFAFSSALLLSSTFLSAAAASNFSLSTPQSLAQCSPATLDWSGGVPPYTVLVYASCSDETPDDGSDAPIVQFNVDNGTSITWTVNIPAQRIVQLGILDATGEDVYSDDVTIESSGNSTSCLDQNAQIVYPTQNLGVSPPSAAALPTTQTQPLASNSTIVPLNNTKNAGVSLSSHGAITLGVASAAITFAALL